MNISIFSEIDSLKSVITHCPGLEHYFINPIHLLEWKLQKNTLEHNPDYLLFDDIIFPNKAIKEHQQLTNILSYFIGPSNCIKITELIDDIINDKNIKYQLIEECFKLDRELYNTPNQSDLLKNKNNEEIIFTLLSGRDYKNNEIIYFKHPIPNLIFTRDIAAVIGNTILVNWGKRKVRNRENIIGKFIFKHHKLFSNSIIYNFHEHHPNHSIEGGDIIVFGNNIVCIGISERTPKESINALLPLIFNEGFSKVYAIDLPKRRSVMHLDTIFNRINKDEVIIYPPIFDPSNINYKPMAIYSISPNKTLFELEPSYDHFIDLLGNDFKKIKTINCGGDKHNNQIREQWTEGANFFAIKPGVIIGYDCNTFTIEALKDKGYKHIKSNYFLQNSSEFDINSKLAITIPASELSRGRGGTRCLTLPISRESKK